MTCAWKELLSILPQWMRQDTDMLGQNKAQEIRLQLGCPPVIRTGSERIPLKGMINREDLNFIVNTATRYSPWAAETMRLGYLTAPGGHRIGLCGEAVMQNGQMTGIRNLSGLNIRIARDIPDLARDAALLEGSILILGAPGWGKTTLLRDLIRQKAMQGKLISVVDERQELFPESMVPEPGVQVLSGCPKALGIDRMLRSMGPEIIAVDEITAVEDCAALKTAAWCGVSLLATAHASSLRDFLHREVYRPLAEQNLFDHLIILRPDKTWHVERSKGWTTNGSVRY